MSTPTKHRGATGALSTLESPWWVDDGEPLTLAAATRLFPRRADGKRISLWTLHRYREQGVALGRGRRLRLRCFRGDASSWATTTGEIGRFQLALTEARGGDA